MDIFQSKAQKLKQLVNIVEKILIKKQKSKFEIFNVGSKKPVSITQLAKTILLISKKV